MFNKFRFWYEKLKTQKLELRTSEKKNNEFYRNVYASNEQNGAIVSAFNQNPSRKVRVLIARRHAPSKMFLNDDAWYTNTVIVVNIISTSCINEHNNSDMTLARGRGASFRRVLESDSRDVSQFRRHIIRGHRGSFYDDFIRNRRSSRFNSTAFIIVHCSCTQSTVRLGTQIFIRYPPWYRVK